MICLKKKFDSSVLKSMYGLTIVKYTETDCSYSIVDSSLTQSKEV